MIVEEPENLTTLAHIKNGVVINMSVSNPDNEIEYEDIVVEIPEGIEAGIGWEYVDGIFIDNREKPEVPEEDIIS
jgi:hypothetical protein